MIVAIDGPAGSGKSTTARAVAERLGFAHLDSGALYRAITFAALQARIPEEQWDDLSAERLDALAVGTEFVGTSVEPRVAGRAVNDALRSATVTERVSRMARIPAVRDWLFTRQREAAAHGDLVADGRDMGTVVFPDADLKIFLVADAETRARRRLRERGLEAPSHAQVQDEVRRIRSRDRADSERETAPLRKARDAFEIDTSELSFEQQVDRIVELARNALPNTDAPDSNRG